MSDEPVMPFIGLRTVIYPAPDLAAAKAAASAMLGVEPYFDTDFYVGYSVAGCEFALDPHADPAGGPTTYWGVTDAAAAVQRLVARGAVLLVDVEEVGDGIRTAIVTMPSISGRIGIIENPHFVAATAPVLGGPGR